MASAEEAIPKGQEATKTYKPENLLKTENSIETCSKRSENKALCECKRVMVDYEDLFDPDINSQLPTNEKMDEMISQYQHVRANCSQCSARDEKAELSCTCEHFEKHRANVLRCRHDNILPYYNGDYIPSTELEWYYQRDRCHACKERRKKRVLCYRKWTKDGQPFRIQDYIPNSYDRYPYWW